MTPTLVTLALLIVVAIAVLGFFQMVLAVQHDRVVDVAPLISSREQVEQEISDSRDTLASINQQIDDRKKAMENVADREAEVAALELMHQDILDQLNRLEDRREEIRQMDRDTDEALVKHGETQRQLFEAGEALEAVQARLDRAEGLTTKIAELEEQKTRISTDVDRLRGEMKDLRQLKEDEAILRERLEDMRREEVRLAGGEQSLRERLDAAAADLAATQKNRAEVQQDQVKACAENSALTVENTKLQGEIGKLGEAKTTLEAAVAALRVQKGELDGTSSPETDPLRDLRSMPAVLQHLRELDLHERENEQDALHRVKRTLKAQGLDYPDRTIRAFHTAMKVNDTTQMAVLAGISGTGKSQLPRRYAEGMGIGFLQVPVQPRWDSPQDLMGFYNYIENRYRPTEMAKALYHLDAFNQQASEGDLQDRMMLILLDEMNLARVEYYFSDFLSRLESRPPHGAELTEANRKDASLELELRMPEGQQAPVIYPGYNLLFAGTMNEDESTQSLSDKVIDRANVIRFAAPKSLKTQRGQGTTLESKALSRTQWESWCRRDLREVDARDVGQKIEEIADLMRDLKRPVGHRMGVAIGAYVANYPEINGENGWQLPLADQVEMRLLPKLRGVEMETARPVIDKLADFVSHLQDEDLALAIRDSAEQSEDTGQFVWRGISRS